VHTFLHADAVDKLFGAYTSIGRFPPRQRPEDTRTCRALAKYRVPRYFRRSEGIPIACTPGSRTA
jgi:hypothetical protein